MKGKFVIALVVLAGAVFAVWKFVPSENNPLVSRGDGGGEALARQHCARCHAFPEPGLLDRETWTQSTLPAMGNYLGILSHEGSHGKYGLTREEDLVASAEIRKRIGMADAPLLESEAWESILNYYAQNAPETLPRPDLDPPTKANFAAKGMKHPKLAGKRPMISGVSILESSGTIAFAGADSPEVGFVNSALQHTGARSVGGTAVDLTPGPRDSLNVSVIGDLEPSERRAGSVIQFTQSSIFAISIAQGLHRPVASLPCDLNGDGREDLVVCEYGHHTGQLIWLEATEEDAFRKRLLLPKPNPVSVLADDVDGDGDVDLYALFAGGSEGIWRFTNDGTGNFVVEELITFPAPTGSVALAMADVNGDGHSDLLHVSGDNDDTSPVLKPYHGLRIYFGDGSGGFALGHFHHMPGAYAIEPADFDLDGDIDIALCAQFGDHEGAPGHSFVILENQGGEELSFAVTSHPATEAIRWACMAAGDIDQDGDIDLVLGAMIPREEDWLSPSPATLEKWKDAPEILLLENLARE